jgi:dephospho-CoA kinase
MSGGPAGRGKPVIGVIGAIGAGKSTVAGWLAENGGIRVDADQVGHQVLNRPEVLEKLSEVFGPEAVGPTGSADRAAIARIVFADPVKRRQLEALVHPLMRRVFEERIVDAQADPAVKWIVLDAAILVEAGWDRLCDAIVLVTAARDRRLARLAGTRGWSEQELDARERAQIPIEAKRRHADCILTNDGDPAACRTKLKNWFAGWTAGRSGSASSQAAEAQGVNP